MENVILVLLGIIIIQEYVLSVTQPAQRVHQHRFVVAVQLDTFFTLTNVALQERQIVLRML